MIKLTSKEQGFLGAILAGLIICFWPVGLLFLILLGINEIILKIKKQKTTS